MMPTERITVLVIQGPPQGIGGPSGDAARSRRHHGGPRPSPAREAEPAPQGCLVEFRPCGCVQHFPYLPAVADLVERHPRDGAWLSHWSPLPTVRGCQAPGRVVAVTPCTAPACPHCSADRVAAWRRAREFPRADPDPDRPFVPETRRPGVSIGVAAGSADYRCESA